MRIKKSYIVSPTVRDVLQSSRTNNKSRFVIRKPISGRDKRPHI